MKKITFLFAFVLAAAAAFAGPYEFGLSLFDEGDYYRAIGEFKRYVFENPKGARVFDARYRAALSYLYAGKSAEAAEHFEKLAYSETGFKSEICILQTARAYQQKKDYKYAGSLLKQFITSKENPDLKEEAVYMLAWNSFLSGDFAASEDAFGTLKSGKLKDAAKQAIDAVSARHGIEQKSPLLAGLLGAIVPGAGHFYCGKIVEGFSSLLITGLLAYNTYEGISSNDHSKAWLYGIPAVTFYGSSVYGAVNAAGRFNDAAAAAFIDSASAAWVEVLEINF